MAGRTTSDEDQGKDRELPERERDVSVWARAHGVSADELSGDTARAQPATGQGKARERRDADAEQGRDRD